MPPAEVAEEGIPALVTGQQLELGVSGPGPSVADQGPTAYAAAAVIGEPAQGRMFWNPLFVFFTGFGCWGEGGSQGV